MPWRAETDQIAIGPRTMFTIYEEPWGDGVPVGSLSPGDQITVRFQNNDRAAIGVVSVTRDEMVIRTTQEGAEWLMVPATKEEKALAVQIEGESANSAVLDRAAPAVKREAEDNWGR